MSCPYGYRYYRYFIDRLFDDLRWNTYISPDEIQVHWSWLHISIVEGYYSMISRVCHLRKLSSVKLIMDTAGSAGSESLRTWVFTAFAEELQEFFKVPRLNKFLETQNCIKKYQLVETFISFLLQLLYDKTDLIFAPCEDRMDNLEKELRCLLTLLGDISRMLCDNHEHEQVQKLLAGFEAVANEAGSLLHSSFFSIHRAFGKMDESLGVVLNHIDLLKANIMRFLNLRSSTSTSAYINPKTSVVNSLLIVDSLIVDLEDLMKREDNPMVDVNDQTKMLYQGLIFAKSSIKDIRSPQSSEVGEWKKPLMRIGDMAHEAEYLIISFSVGNAPLWYLINRLTDINHKIYLIGTELQEIKKKQKSGDLKAAKDYGAQLPSQAKRDNEVDDITIGLEDKATDLLHQLVGETERLQTITIFGMPGLGKTTLAKKLYNHPLVVHWFDKQSWCVVSQTYQRKSTLTTILIHIKSELEKDRILQMEEEKLAEQIYKTLKGRRYLIVMDDMWDSNVWGDLWRYFPDDRNGSGILFTTRNKNVAPPNGIVYEQPLLADDECWELLEKKVFDSKHCPPELLGIGKRIAANCRGLPLAVVVIAGTLSTRDQEKTAWEEVERNLASYIVDGGDNSVMQILELSYKHLPDHLKPCFLYFGAFQEDKEIPVQNLLRLWMAEGFISKEEDKSTESLAEEYLMELIDKSLVMVAKRRSDGGVKTCVVHDLLRDLCVKRSEEESFLSFVKNDIFIKQENGHRLQELSAHARNFWYCQNARSFHGRYLLSPIYVRDMILLRVFYFDNKAMPNPFIGIEFLINLRYLVISDLPPSIDSLVNLEYLCVRTRMIVYLPPAISNMMKLRNLHVDSEARYNDDWSESQTNNLEFLSRIAIKTFKDEEMLKCSPHLRKLKCKFDPSLSYDYREMRLVDLGFLTQLESLNLQTYEYRAGVAVFPPNIKKLILNGLRLRDQISIIGKLEHLEVLKLRSCYFEDKRWDTRDGEFQKLRFLELKGSNLTEWNVGSKQHFPRLQRLVLSNCDDMQEIPSEIGEIATLQLIEVQRGHPKSLIESAKRIQQEQVELGNEGLRVIIGTPEVPASKWKGVFAKAFQFLFRKIRKNSFLCFQISNS